MLTKVKNIFENNITIVKLGLTLENLIHSIYYSTLYNIIRKEFKNLF